MKKLLWAAVLALPCLAISHSRATAQPGCCYNLAGGFHVKFCGTGFLKCWSEPFCGCTSCKPGGCNGGYAGGPAYGGGYAGGCANCPGGDCSGHVPGPWYTYWPYSGQPFMTSPYATDSWTYESNFQVPAPVYPFWPVAANGAAPPAAVAAAAPYSGGFQPAGYYPSYWYGK